MNSSLILIAFILLSFPTLSQEKISTNLLGDSIALESESVLVVVNKLNCSKCLEMLKDVKTPSFTRYVALIGYKDKSSYSTASLMKFISLTDIPFDRFIGLNPSLHNNKEEHTPYLLFFHKDGEISQISYDELFSDDTSISDLKRKIKQHLKKRK